MPQGREYVYSVCGYLLIGVLLILPVSCAVQQQGTGGSLMGVQRGQQKPSDQPPPDQQGYPVQDQRRK
jgi:hypothetical protein